MNVAVCVSGLTRSVSYTWPLIERYLVRPYNSSIFLHTWDIDNGGERFNCTMKGIIPAPSITDGRTKDQFIQQEIKPEKYIIESYEEFSKEHSNLINKSMYYGIYKAQELKQTYEKETGTVFDLVIRTRMDVFYETFMIQKEIDEVLANNKVVYGCLPGTNPDSRFITDAFAFGSQSVMDVYANTWKQQAITSGTPGELILQKQLFSNSINFKWSNIKYKMITIWNSRDVHAWGDF